MGLPTAWALRRLCRQMQSCSRLGICTNRIQQATSNHRRPPPAWAFAICSGGCEAVHNLGGCTAEEFQLAFQATGTRQHSMGICDVLYRQKRSFSRPGQLYRSGVAAGDFRPHELANTAWAFATFDQADAKPFVSVALARSEVAFRRLQSTGACQHSMGIATFVQSNAKLFATLACAHRSLSLGDFKPLELANAAWALRRVIRRMRSCSQSRQLHSSEFQLATSNHRNSPTQHGHLRRLFRQMQSYSRPGQLHSIGVTIMRLRATGACQHSMGICDV